MYLTRSFVGNKISIEWPSRTGSDNHCVIICAQCAEVINVTPTGHVVAVGRKGMGDAFIRKTKGK
jgi:hypothetical protein